MSEHAWTQDHIAAHVAGGLDPAEAERLDAHVRECPACAAALADARSLDRGLDSLFAPARPGPALEDRAVRSLHTIRATDLLRPRWKRRLLIGVAASVALGLTAAVGAGMSAAALDGRLQFPGLTGDNGDGESFPNDSIARASQDGASGMDLQWGKVSAARSYRDQAAAADSFNGSGRMNSMSPLDGTASVRDPEAMARDFAERMRPRPVDQLVASERTQSFDRPLGEGAGSTGKSNYSLDFGYHRSVQGNAGPMGPGTARTYSPVDWYSTPVQPGNMGPGQGRTSGLIASSKDGDNLTEFRADDKPVEKKAMESRASLHYESFAPASHKPEVTWKDDGEIRDLESRQDKSREKEKKLFLGGKSLEDSISATNGTWAKNEPKARPAIVAPIIPALGTPEPPPPVVPPAATPQKIIIRSGDIEFEIESFDSAVAGVIKLVTAIKNGYVATINSEKLANGKVKGSIVVRVPPEALDGLVLDLRRDLGKGGELKGQRIGSQDITKQYTDIESRLKAAKTMEQRLLNIIKEGKGEIKQLLEAEKELGVWRTRSEEMEGELRFYSNQVSLSTLTITLAEKEIKTAAGLTESERVQAGIEVEDVEKAQQQLLAAVSEAKGRVTRSEMKQVGTGQFNATVNFEVAPEQAGALRDRLRQLGVMARLEIDRVQQAEGGNPPKDTKDLKIKRGDTIFVVQLYNTARITARETATVQFAAPDVPAAYRTLQEAVARAKGRVLKAKLDEQDRKNVTAEFDFEVKRTEEAAVQAAFAAAGDVISRNVVRISDEENSTDAKVLFHTTLLSAARLNPRETTTLAMEVGEVDQTAAVFAAQVKEAGGRVVDENVAHERSGRVTARLIYDVPLVTAASMAERFKSAGTVRVQQTARDPHAHDGKLAIARLDVTLSNAELLVPRGEGIWPQVRSGLSWSARVLLLSLSWLIVGLCVLLPWGVLAYAGYRIVRRLFFPAPLVVTPVAPAPPPAA